MIGNVCFVAMFFILLFFTITDQAKAYDNKDTHKRISNLAVINSLFGDFLSNQFLLSKGYDSSLKNLNNERGQA